MRISSKGLALIQQFEGFRALPYLCPAGYWTVGYGHVIQPGEDFADGIDEAQATELLSRDVAQAERQVSRQICIPLTEGQCDALISFAFNVGGGALQRSTLRQKVNRAEHVEVPREFLRWVWAGGKKQPGLLLRRRAEAAIYME